MALAPPPARTDIEFLRLAEVIDRHHPDDQFTRAWSSYDRVAEGNGALRIGHHRN
jgi:hypothetical protein